MQERSGFILSQSGIQRKAVENHPKNQFSELKLAPYSGENNVILSRPEKSPHIRNHHQSEENQSI